MNINEINMTITEDDLLIAENELDNVILDEIVGQHEFNAYPVVIDDLKMKLWKEHHYLLVIDGVMLIPF